MAVSIPLQVQKSPRTLRILSIEASCPTSLCHILAADCGRESPTTESCTLGLNSWCPATPVLKPPGKSSVVSSAKCSPHPPQHPAEAKPVTPPAPPLLLAGDSLLHWRSRNTRREPFSPPTTSRNSPFSSLLPPIWLSRRWVPLLVRAAISIHQSRSSLPPDIPFFFSSLLSCRCNFSLSTLSLQQLTRPKYLKSEREKDRNGNSCRSRVVLGFIGPQG